MNNLNLLKTWRIGDDVIVSSYDKEDDIYFWIKVGSALLQIRSFEEYEKFVFLLTEIYTEIAEEEG